MKTLYNTLKVGLAGLAMLTVGCPPSLQSIEGKVEDEKYIPATMTSDSVYQITLDTEDGVKVVNVLDSSTEGIKKENVDYLIGRGMTVRINSLWEDQANSTFIAVKPRQIELLSLGGMR